MTSVAAHSYPSLNMTMNGLPASSRYASGGPRPPHGTINALFFDAVERFDRADALSTKVHGVWEPMSHRTILERVRCTARTSSGSFRSLLLTTASIPPLWPPRLRTVTGASAAVAGDLRS